MPTDEPGSDWEARYQASIEAEQPWIDGDRLTPGQRAVVDARAYMTTAMFVVLGIVGSIVMISSGNWVLVTIGVMLLLGLVAVVIGFVAKAFTDW